MEDKCVYFDGLSAQANLCNIHLTDDCVYVYLIEQNNKSLIFNKAEIVSYHLNENHLTIKIGSYPHHVIECYGKLAITLHADLSKGNVLKTTESFMHKHRLAVVLSLCVFFIGVAALSYFVVLPWVGEKSASLIPIEAEIKLGESIAESVNVSNETNDSATYYTNLFLKQLKTQSPYAINLTVIESSEINAFAVPGGKIFIYSGIIKKMNSHEELAALLGHEISHVTYQHSLKSICRTLSSSLLIAALFGDASGITAGLVQQADQFKQLDYSRELETQADEKGYEMLLQNNLAPKGMVDLLTMLQKESLSMPEIMKYFSSHPETQERINNIKAKPQANKTFDVNEDLQTIFNKIKYHTD